MEETIQPLLIGDDPDATVVAPRFDVVESDTAQPVVPLAVVSTNAPEAVGGYVATSYAASGYGKRRSWPLAVVLISALIGSAVGVAGLYFYQKRQPTEAPLQVETPSGPQEAAAPPVETPPTPTVATPEKTIERVALPSRSNESAEPSAVTARPASAPARREVVDSRKHDAEDTKKAPAAVETRKARREHDDDERAATGKRGKRHESDDERAVEEQRPRRVGTIVYPEGGRESRPPRAVRERGRRAVDRVRGIFEGQPPR